MLSVEILGLCHIISCVLNTNLIMLHSLQITHLPSALGGKHFVSSLGTISILSIPQDTNNILSHAH